MSFKLTGRRIDALIAIARMEDGMPCSAWADHTPMLAELGLVIAKHRRPEGGGERVWQLTPAGRRAVEQLTGWMARKQSGDPGARSTTPLAAPIPKGLPSHPPFRF